LGIDDQRLPNAVDEREPLAAALGSDGLLTAMKIIEPPQGALCGQL
jgi:hypothetical protein